jgi:hypothetical protein
MIGCSKNTEAWNKAKELYPVSLIDIDGEEMDTNEQARLRYIDTVAGRCQEFVYNDALDHPLQEPAHG